MSEYPSREQFASQLNEKFTVQLSGGETLDLTLVDVTMLGERETDEGLHESFSLVFAGPPDIMLHQRTFDVSNDQLGEMAIFLVPITPEDNTLRYEAIFN